MCGRFISGADEISWQEYCEILRLPTSAPVPEQGDLFPTQNIAIVRADTAAISRELASLRWGLVPQWLKDKNELKNLINVRGETAHSKFREPFEKTRCVIPASGFYEWKKIEGLTKKFQHRIFDEAHPIFSMAGLWTRWVSDDGESLESCAIITTEACAVMRELHDRMPVILTARGVDEWLDPTSKVPELEGLLVPYGAESLIVEPMEPVPEQGSLF